MVIFEEMFIKSKGKPIRYQNKELSLSDKIIFDFEEMDITLDFIENNSDWRQGIILETEGSFFILDQKIRNKIILWYDTAPKSVQMVVHSESKELILYNVWDVGNGTVHSWHHGAAMYVNISNDSRTYYCNDGYPDDDLNDLIFQLKIKKNNS